MGLRLLILILGFHSIAFATPGFVHSGGSNNQALLVGVSHGLPGLDIDILNIEQIATHPDYAFHVQDVQEEEATKANIYAKLHEVAGSVQEDGTLLFYYTGHGYYDSLYLQDGSIYAHEIREAIESARADTGPLARLTIVIDACHSGTLLDPFRSKSMANEFAKALAPKRNGRSYWDSLMIIASTLPDETCLAGEEGSQFTNALVKAYSETVQSQGNVNQMIALTKEYILGSTPSERLVPASLGLDPVAN